MTEADMSNWTPVEYRNIFTYFIAQPDFYTFEHLLSWKQFDGYTIFA